MRNPNGDFIWYELMTRDPAAAKKFYDPVAGWTVEGQPSGPLDYRMIDTGDGLVGGTLTLTDAMCEDGARPVWMGYIGVDDVDDTLRKVEAEGGSVQMPAQDIPNVGRIAMAADPQGNSFYVMRGAVDDVSRAFAPETAGHGSWNELSTSDLDSAKRFYPAVFGWTLGDVMPMGEMGDYQFIDLGGRMIGAMMKTPPQSPASGWNYAFRSADLDRAAKQIPANGGTVLQGPMDIPGGRAVMAKDAEGIYFMLSGD